MTRRMVFRRILIALAVIVLCLAGLAVALPSIMSSQLVRQEVASQISALTGRAVTLRGDQALQVFPNLSVHLSDVVIAGDLPGVENALIVTEALRGAVRALPLLFGRIEMSSFELTRPTIRLVRLADGQTNWGLDGSALTGALEPDRVSGSGLQLGRFRIIDGTFHFNDAVHGTNETVTGANMALSWPSSSMRAAISGSAIWRGEAVEFSASLGQPAALIQAGSTSGVALSLSGAPLRLRFDGTVSPGSLSGSGDASDAPWQANGVLSISTPSLRRAVSWLGTQMDAGSTFGAFRLDADLNMVGASADLTDVVLSLDGNDAEGVLTLDLDGYENGSGQRGRPAIQGTLDFERLDLSAYLDTVRPTTTTAAPGDWLFLAVPNVFASRMDLDLRLASRQVLASALTFGETAGSLLLSSDRMVLGIAEAIAYGGALRGSITLDRRSGALTTGLDLSADALQVGPVLAAFQTQPRLTGTLTARALVSGQGETLVAILESLEGDAQVGIANGILNGVDLNKIGRAFADGSFDFASFDASGQTALTALSGELYARGGYVQVRDMLLEAESVSLTLTGQSELATRLLNFSGATAIDAGRQTVVVPFDIRGTWASPLLLPDLRALEERRSN